MKHLRHLLTLALFISALPLPSPVAAAPALPASQSAIVGTGNAASCTWAALGTAVATAGEGGTVSFNCGQSVSSPVTITAPAGQRIAMTAGTLIDGGAAGAIALDGGQVAGAGFFDVPAAQKLELRNLLLLNAGDTAITSAGELTLRAVLLSGSRAASCAGVRQTAGLFKTFDNSNINANHATGAGGGLCVEGGLAELAAGTLAYNQAERGGGAYVSAGELRTEGTYFSNNQTQGPGAGVFVGPAGSLRLSSSALAQGVANTSLFTATGGGLHNEGIAHLHYSVLVENSAHAGGGVLNLGTLTSLGSDMVQNSATTQGGALMSLGDVSLDGGVIVSNTASGTAGGILNVTGAMTLSNLTIAGNSGNPYSNELSGDTLLRHVTVWNNAPNAMRSSGLVRVRGSILQGCTAFESRFLSLDHNIDAGSTCVFTGTHDLNNTNPQLSDLLATSERPTWHFAPAASSPAIDAGGATCGLGSDQHGVARPAGAGCDIGSIETLPAPAFNAVSVISSTPPVNELRAGLGSVSVQGTLANIAPALRSSTQVDVMLRTTSGQNIVLNTQPGTLNAAGQFQVNATLPSLYSGDAVPSFAGGSLSVVGRAGNGMTAQLGLGPILTTTFYNPRNVFSFTVVRASDGLIVPDTPANALRINVQPEAMVMANSESLNTAVFTDALNAAFAKGFNDQLGASPLIGAEVNKWMCEKFEIVNEPRLYAVPPMPADQFNLGAMLSQGRLLNPGLGAAGLTRIGALGAIGNPGLNRSDAFSVEVRFVVIKVDASNVVDAPAGSFGYGPVDPLNPTQPDINPFAPRKSAYEELYAYLPERDRVFLVTGWRQFDLRRLQFVEQPHPVTIRLAAYAPGAAPLLAAELSVPGAQYIERNINDSRDGNGQLVLPFPYPTFGHFTSFAIGFTPGAQPGVPPIDLKDGDLNVVLRLQGDNQSAIQGSLRVTMTIVPKLPTGGDGFPLVLPVQAGTVVEPSRGCGLTAPTLDLPARIYTGTLGSAGRNLPPGKHRVEVQMDDGRSVVHERADLVFDKLPAWYLATNLRDRSASWGSARSVITATKFDASNDRPLDATLDFKGEDVQFNQPVANSSGLKNVNVQVLPSSGRPFTSQPSGSRGKSLNDPIPEQSNSSAAAGAGGLARFTPAALGRFHAPGAIYRADETVIHEERFEKSFGTGERSQTLFPPLMYGFVPLASVRLSASLHYNIGVTVTGVLKMSDTPDLALTVWPYARIGVKIDIAGEILGGLVARFGARANPNMSMDAPLHFSAAGKNDAKVCFRFRLDLTLYAGFVCNPFSSGYENCAFQKAKTINALHGNEPQSEFCNALAGNGLLRESDTLGIDTAFAADPPPPEANPAIATDGTNTLAVWNSETNGMVYSTFDGAAWSDPLPLTSGIAERAAVAYYDVNKAVAVWNASDLTYTPGLSLTIDDAMSHQHLAYALWDGIAWSAPLPLTAPSTGDGGAVLAGCMAGAPGCPAGGAVTAAWTHIAGGTFEEHQFRVHTTRFTGGAWGTIEAADPASTSMDTAPALTYVNGEAVLAWVRDGDRSLTTASDRRITLRRMNSATVETPAGLPDSIVVTSLATGADGKLVFGFTRAVGEALMSNTNELYAARETCAPACSVAHVALRDDEGRALRGQRPLVTVDQAGRASITYRGMGFGAGNDGLAERSFDAPGLLLGTGELAQVEVNFAAPNAAPKTLTNDGAVNWQNAAVYNPTLDKVIALAVRGNAPVQAQGLARGAGSNSTQQIRANQPIVFAASDRRPDFALRSITPGARFAEDGGVLSAQVQLVNNGVAWSGSLTQPLQVLASWDAMPGTVGSSGTAVVSALRGGEAATLTLTLAPPAGSLNVTHTLYVQLRAPAGISETTLVNNVLTAVVGGVPAPYQARTTTDPRLKLTGVTWDAPVGPGPAISSYRIYRRTGAGAWQRVGSSLGTTWSDLNAQWNTDYDYAVSSITVLGYESALSAPMRIRLTPLPVLRVYLPVAAR